PTAILTKADGKVLRAIPGSDLVYIDLGSNDGVKVGMGFEVFSKVDIPEGLRGKASLEVATVMSDTAECRVTRSTPSKPIIEDDLVVNIAFERNRLPKFVVKGDCDLDYDGQPDGENGREKVAGLIRQWGGQVAPELDETTDFVVIGTAPFVPVIPVGETATATIMAQADAARLARVDFQDLIARANATYIPVITQSQFLFLTGYAQGLFGEQ
ncbi:MAG: hypothetical protein JXO22_11880, partial [Phycisphaerae bacterium]|nr:hypothetical protein [Phycisphaerae bacterium]